MRSDISSVKSGQIDFVKASETFNIPKSTLRGRALGLSKWSAHGNILLTELFATTNNEVIKNPMTGYFY